MGSLMKVLVPDGTMKRELEPPPEGVQLVAEPGPEVEFVDAAFLARMKLGAQFLNATTVIAVVGASRDPSKAGGSVPAGLQKRGFRIIPINPYADTLFGEHVYRSLAEVPEKIDLVDVFRPAADAPDIARQAVAVGAKALRLQLDIRSDEARRIAEAAGLDYVEDERPAVPRARYRTKKRAAPSP